MTRILKIILMTLLTANVYSPSLTSKQLHQMKLNAGIITEKLNETRDF